jgi:Na+/phosphate symporter
MKDKRIFFNPLRMISPKLNHEVERIEELHEAPVSESVTLEEGLVIMLSKLIRMTGLLETGFARNCPDEFGMCDQLAADVHQQEKLLTGNLICSVDVAPELCRLILMFPAHLERVGDSLESILNCIRIKCREQVPFDDRAMEEIQEMFAETTGILTDFRDAIIAPNRFLLESVVSRQASLDQKCQDWELAHVDRLLNGTASHLSSSVYLDILESTQNLSRHIKEMAERMLELLARHEAA